MNARQRLPGFAAGSLVALVLAACGSDDGDTTAPAPAPTAVGGVVQQPAVQSPDPAWLTASEPVATLTRSQVDDAMTSQGWTKWAGPARCDVAIHSIRHPATGPNGEATDASGAVFVPRGPDCPGPYPVLSYSRGTDLDRSRSMTTPDERETQAVVGFFAARGWVVVASDYLGFADSSFPYHPYLHAETEAGTNAAALRAGRSLLAKLGVAESGRLALAGYSQGGHAALATQRLLERDAQAGVPAPVAVGAMSGPYDLVGSFGEVARLAPLLSTSIGSSIVRNAVALRLGAELGSRADELIASGGRLAETLQSNTVVGGWKPRAPILLCGGSRDPVVPFSNAERSAARLRADGGTVTVVDVEREPTYSEGLPPPGASASDLGGYHQRDVPPRCFAAVRDRLLVDALR